MINTLLPVIQETPSAPLQLQIENNTPDSLIYEFPNGSRFDIAVRVSQRIEVARWSNTW